jgi:hypothetical protein
MPRKKIPAHLTLIEDDGVRLWVSIQARRRNDAILFLVLWLAAWTTMGVTGAAAWWRSPYAAWWHLALGAIILAANLGITMLALLYYRWGRDVLIARPGRLTVREEVFGWGLGRSYAGSTLEFLELESRDGLRSRGLSDPEIDDNSLWLEYRRKLIPVGAGLTIEHADHLRRRIMVRVMTGVPA